MKRLLEYFSGTCSDTLETIGAEIETQFVNEQGLAVSTEQSQKMLVFLTTMGWQMTARKNGLITTLMDYDGNQILYELGRHNIELSTRPCKPENVIATVYDRLEQVYCAAKTADCTPFFEPVLQKTNEDLLVVPDERDATWLELDGRTALANLARTSSVQFTFSVSHNDALPILNRLGWRVGEFLKDYPQDEIWKGYIAGSKAGYQSDRYGGPLLFDELKDYCVCLAQHGVVTGPRLTPFDEASNINIPLFLRSIWWHFRLKRYNNDLCIEVRPMPRRSDMHIKHQFDTMMNMISA